MTPSQNQKSLYPFAALAALMGLYGCDVNVETVYPDQIAAEKILKPVLISAHRGGMAYAPENTVVGFKNGLRLKSDILELDVQVRENEILVLHDFTLDRTTNCSMQSWDADAAARSSCDAGFSWRPGTSTFSNGFGLPLLRGKGIDIPLLGDVIDGVSDSNAIFMVELKHGDRGPNQTTSVQALDTLMTFIVERSLERRISFTSFNPQVLSQAEAKVPSVSTMLLWDSNSPKSCEQNVLDVISRGFDGIAPAVHQYKVPPQEFVACIQLAQEAGLKVAFWIVNSPEQVEQLLPLKPDILITDFPACLAALLHNTRIENPYPEEVPSGAWLPKCG